MSGNNSNNDDKFVRSVLATAENLSRVAIGNDISLNNRSRKESESKMDLALLRASLADAERSARAQLVAEQRGRGGGGDDSAGYSAYASSKEEEDSEDDFESQHEEEEEIVKPDDDSLSSKKGKVAVRTQKKLSKRSSSTFVPPKQLLLYLVR